MKHIHPISTYFVLTIGLLASLCFGSTYAMTADNNQMISGGSGNAQQASSHISYEDCLIQQKQKNSQGQVAYAISHTTGFITYHGVQHNEFNVHTNNSDEYIDPTKSATFKNEKRKGATVLLDSSSTAGVGESYNWYSHLQNQCKWISGQQPSS